MVRYRRLWSQVTWVTSRAVTKALVMAMMRETREIEQVESNVKMKQCEQDLLAKLSSTQRGVQNWCIAEL